MNHITEIVPDERPEWFQKAMEEGQLFRVAIAKVEELERQNKVLELALGAVAERNIFLLGLIPPKKTKIAKDHFNYYPFKNKSPHGEQP